MKDQLRNSAKKIRTEFVYRISNPRRLYFTHLPKCAGTSVYYYLEKHYPKRVIFRTNSRNPKKSFEHFQSLNQQTRHRYRLIAGHQPHQMIEYIHPDSVTFTIFRDPVERIISHYYFVKRDKQNYLHDWVINEDIQLEAYVTSGKSWELRNYYTTFFTGCSIEEVETNPADSVKMAFEIIKEQYDLVGFQDNLKPFMDNLRRVARLRIPFKNHILNRSGNRPKNQKVPKDIKDTIAETNFLDVELFSMLKTHLA